MRKRDLATELCLAVFHARPEEVQALVTEGADVDGVADRRVASVGEQTPLWTAASSAGQEISPAWKDLCEGLSAIVPSIPPRDIADKRRQYVSIANALLDAGADPNKLSHGSTPLRIAVARQDLEMVELFLRRGANPNAECFSVLSKLTRKEGRKTIPAYYNTVLHEAVEKNSLPIVKMLVNAGAGVSRTDHEGKTPLQIAHAKGFAEIAEFLERAGET